MERVNYSPKMIKHIVGKDLFANNPLCIVDVGASGGIASYWNVFGPSLKGFAFEPLLAECERLNSESSKLKEVNYYPYLVGAEEGEIPAGIGSFCRSFERSSTALALELKKINFSQSFFNRGEKPICSDQRTSLDRFFSDHPVETIDCIKTDTDGYDYEVLHGARNTLRDKQVLCLVVEANFPGHLHQHSNTFRNIDRLLSEAGFYLYDMDIYRYSRAALPGKFHYRLPAQTTTGQVVWGDALYFRDPITDQIDLSPEKLLKLACLYELFGLPDCAAELLNTYKDPLSQLIDIPHCLNLLAQDMGIRSTYSEHIDLFKRNFENFYPSLYQTIQKKVYKFLKLDMASKKKVLSRKINSLFR